jgi:hypothetical protein
MVSRAAMNQFTGTRRFSSSAQPSFASGVAHLRL